MSTKDEALLAREAAEVSRVLNEVEDQKLYDQIIDRLVEHGRVAAPTESCRRACRFLIGVASLLLEKNAKYGDSAANPKRIFARGLKASDGVRVRIDDKLSRLMTLGIDPQADEDTVRDLTGYLAILRAVTSLEAEDPRQQETKPLAVALAETERRSPGRPFERPPMPGEKWDGADGAVRK